MFEQDYLMRILLQFAEIVRRSWTKANKEHDPKEAADMLEDAVGEATDMDGGMLLSLSPESIASVMQVSGVDPRVTEYIARSLLLAAGYLREAGDDALADVREAQARAVAEAYGFELPATFEELEGMLDEMDAADQAGEGSTFDLLGYGNAPVADADPLVAQVPPREYGDIKEADTDEPRDR